MKNAIFTLTALALTMVLSCSRMANKSERDDTYVSEDVSGAPSPGSASDGEKSKARPGSLKLEMRSGKPGLEIESKRSKNALFYSAPDFGKSRAPDPIMYRLDAGSSYSYDAAPLEYDKGFESEAYKNSVGDAGILTAGELHDFNKWKLWTDIATDALGLYQEQWTIRPMERYSVQVSTDKGRPVVDAVVELLAEGSTVVWRGKTDNTGKAELWADMYENRTYIKKPEYTIRVKHQGKTMNRKASAFGENGVNHIMLAAQCDISEAVDAMFVVDATGSMGDEINYLKSELNSIIGKFKQQNKDLNLRIGSVFYRDEGDEYVTRESDFSDNPFKTIDFIKNQYANGGGDFPEAVEKALEKAMSMDWSDNARARLLFLVLDAPPHQTPEVKESLQKSIDKAAKMGIRIIPITASGIDKATEYLMRSMALATNGTYVFLTDHSGVGNPHIEPTTDSYEVEKLNDLLLRLFTQFTYAPDCKQQPTSQLPDTSRIFNPMDHVPADTGASSFKDPEDTAQHDTDPFHTSKPAALVYYPNPTRGLLNVEVEGDTRDLYLADISGKLLEKYAVGEQRTLKLRLDNYPAGMYFLKCEAGGQWLSGKVILVR